METENKQETSPIGTETKPKIPEKSDFEEREKPLQDDSKQRYVNSSFGNTQA